MNLSDEGERAALRKLLPLVKFPVLHNEARGVTVAESSIILEHKVVGDKLRPEGSRDPYGVEQAKAQIASAYAIADDWLRADPWAAGATFTMADCAAAPAPSARPSRGSSARRSRTRRCSRGDARRGRGILC